MIRPVAVILGAAVLLMAPGIQLVFGPGPARFGFQMYSGYGELNATWTDLTGAEHPIDLNNHLAVPRTEIDWTVHLPSRLCAALPDAHAVEVRQAARGGDRVRILTCSR